ncbi:MAG TPA: MFS transporter, partial [Nitrospira sp.]|nr:MFS transporter [Nitrospira sp.]
GNAMGLLGTMSAIGTALGPSLGGILIVEFGWRAIFLINLPLGLMIFFSHIDTCLPIVSGTRLITPGSTMRGLYCLG